MITRRSYRNFHRYRPRFNRTHRAYSWAVKSIRNKLPWKLNPSSAKQSHETRVSEGVHPKDLDYLHTPADVFESCPDPLQDQQGYQDCISARDERLRQNEANLQSQNDDEAEAYKMSEEARKQRLAQREEQRIQLEQVQTERYPRDEILRSFKLPDEITRLIQNNKIQELLSKYKFIKDGTPVTMNEWDFIDEGDDARNPENWIHRGGRRAKTHKKKSVRIKNGPQRR